mgnify:CR=1 FL=1
MRVARLRAPKGSPGDGRRAGARRAGGALAEAFGVQDEYRTGGDLQPATGGEVRQRLVDRLPRGSDQLSQFLLGQVVMDVQPVAFLLAEPGRQVEQVLRHAPGDVGETRSATTSLARRSRRASACSMCMETSGRSSSQPAQRVMGSAASVASVTALADDVRGRGSNSDSSPNISPGPITLIRFLPAVGRRPRELDLAFQHDVQPVALLTLQEEMLAPGQLDVGHLPPDRPRAILVEPFEQRCPPEHNFGVLHRILLAGISAAGRRQRAGPATVLAVPSK